MSSDRQGKMSQRAELLGQWRELGRISPRWKAQVWESQINITQLNFWPRSGAMRVNQIVHSLEFIKNFHESIWLHHPNSTRQKEVTGNRLKSNCSARNRFILTLPTGFSIRGLVKQTGVMLLYIESFHCCSYKKVNRERDFRDLAGFPDAWSHFLVSHNSASST